MKKGFFLLVALTTFLVSCQKDKHLSLRTNGIVQGSWKVKARETIKSTTPGIIDYNVLSAEEQITRYRFFPNGDMARISTFLLDTFQVADSAISGKWLLRYADTRLRLTDPKIAGEYDFIGYDDSTMTLQRVVQTDENDSTTTTTIFRRQ